MNTKVASLLILVVSATFVSHRLFFGGILSQGDASPLVAPPSNVDFHRKEQHNASVYINSLPVCHHFAPSKCEMDTLPTRLKLSLTAAAKMHHDVCTGVGGGMLSFLCLVFAVFAVIYSERAARMMNKQKVEKSSGTVDLEEGGSYLVVGTTSSLVRRPNCSFKGLLVLGMGAIYMKVYLALLMIIDLNNLMVPEASLLAAPEILQLYKSSPAEQSEGNTLTTHGWILSSIGNELQSKVPSWHWALTNVAPPPVTNSRQITATPLSSLYTRISVNEGDSTTAGAPAVALAMAWN